MLFYLNCPASLFSGCIYSEYGSALRLDPKLASSLYGRELARVRKGDAAGGNADIAAAKTIAAKIADDFARYGLP